MYSPLFIVNFVHEPKPSTVKQNNIRYRIAYYLVFLLIFAIVMYLFIYMFQVSMRNR